MFNENLTLPLAVIFLLVSRTSPQPLQCPPCVCHHAPGLLNLTCNSVDFNTIDWNHLPHLETNAHFTNMTNFGFQLFPAIWRNLTTTLIVSHVEVNDFDLSGFFVIKTLSIENARILNPDDLITVQKTLRELSVTKTDLSIFSLNDNFIEHLDLSDNRLETIPVSSQLSTLLLRNNRIQTLSTTSCVPIKGLSLLDLTGNQLTDLPENAFDCIIAAATASAPKLTVNLSRNSIRTIHPRAFVNIGIEKLDLSNNKLRAVDSTALDWHNLKYLNLQHNPWNCQCANQWMLDELIPHLYKFNQGLIYHFRCGSPRDKQDRPLAYWLNHSHQVFCESNNPHAEFLFGDLENWSPTTYVVIVLGIIIICLLLSIIILLCCCVRDRIALKIQKRRHSARYSLINNESKNRTSKSFL